MLSFHMAAPAFVAPHMAVAASRSQSIIAMQATSDDEATIPAPKPPYTTMVVGDGTLAGDMGFDPLLLADTPKKLAWFREVCSTMSTL